MDTCVGIILGHCIKSEMYLTVEERLSKSSHQHCMQVNTFLCICHGGKLYPDECMCRLLVSYPSAKIPRPAIISCPVLFCPPPLCSAGSEILTGEPTRERRSAVKQRNKATSASQQFLPGERPLSKPSQNLSCLAGKSQVPAIFAASEMTN